MHTRTSAKTQSAANNTTWQSGREGPVSVTVGGNIRKAVPLRKQDIAYLP